VNRQPPGYAVITDNYGGVTEADTYHCCHCQRLIHVRPGSGTQRGYCMNCNAITCGQPWCVECRPFMRKIEEMENRHRLRMVMERGYDR